MKIRLFAVVATLAALVACATVPESARHAALGRDIAARAGVDAETVAVADRERLRSRRDTLLAAPLSPGAAVEVALLGHRDLNALLARYGVAQAEYLERSSLPNPVLDVEALWEDGGGSADLDVSVSHHLLSVLRLKASREIAEADLEAAAHEATDQVLALRKTVLDAWFEHVADQQRLELRRSIVAATAAGYDFARRLHEAGNITGLALANEQALYEEARIALDATERASLASRERLGRALGVPEQAWTAPSRLPRLPVEALAVDDLADRAVMENLGLAARNARITAQFRRLGIDRSTRALDELEFGVAGEREEGEWSRGVEVGVSLPVFQQGQARVQRREQELLAMEAELASATLNLRSLAREAAVGLERARRLLANDIDVMLPLTERIVSETQREYNAMQVGLFELLVARQRRILAGEAFVTHLKDYWLARNAVDHLLAGGTPGSLPQPAGDVMSLAGAADGGH